MSTATAVHAIVAKPPKELFDFAKRQVFNTKSRQGGERRVCERDAIAVPVVVQPVDKRLMPVGGAFHVVTRDLSPKGVGLVHLVPIPGESLALHMVLANTEVNLLVRVVWRGPLGPFYGTGAEFTSKLQHFPQYADFTDCGTSSQPNCLSPLALAAEQCLRTTRGLADDCDRARDGLPQYGARNESPAPAPLAIPFLALSERKAWSRVTEFDKHVAKSDQIAVHQPLEF
jgi:hypothetical protein